MIDSRLQPKSRVLMMPRDTNPAGTIFGGVILSYMDQAGAEEALCHGARRVVTVAMNEVIFHQPVFVGDLVSFSPSWCGWGELRSPSGSWWVPRDTGTVTRRCRSPRPRSRTSTSTTKTDRNP